jgi:transporter family protein
MERWVVYAFISMFFAGFTSVIAKQGLTGISGELGLTIRTLLVFAMVLVFALLAIPAVEFKTLQKDNWLWLGLSGLTTTLSWIFYYKALKLGEVGTIALIDKGSVLVAILLAWLVLKEEMTPRLLLGAALVLSGLLVIARK